jgi:hypothetical protein
MKVELSGNSIKVYSGSTLVVEATDSQFSSGYVGFGGNTASGSFDNVTVTSNGGATVFRGMWTAGWNGVPQILVRQSGDVLAIRTRGVQGMGLVVIDVAGRVIHRDRIVRDEYAVPVGSLEPGMYVVRVGSAQARFLVSH